MLKIGITGGIGSGKSTVSKIFEVLGIPAFYADDATKNIMNESPVIRKKLIEYFGEEAYTGDLLNRKFIASQVFNDKEKLAFLNSVTHPEAIRYASEWMQKQTTPYAIKEAALFFESGSQEGIDVMIGVYTPKAMRIHRIMQRDNVTREEVLKRMQNQINEEIKMRLCDYVIVNDEQHPVIEQVLKLHEKFLEEAGSQ
jgi:dephospho-CoA kinase